jgi:hypothetical protein
VRPRRIWYVVAAVLALVLSGAGAAVIVVTVKDTVNSVDSDRSFPGGSSQKFSFTEGETKAVFVSQAGEGQVSCRAPEMESGAMTRPDSTYRVTLGSRTWERVFEVKPGSSGDYTLTCTSDQQAEFAVGDKPEVGATVGGIFAAVGLFIAAVGSAVTITIVTTIRRGRHRRRLADAMASAPPPQWGPGPSGPPPGPHPGPWPPG